MNVADYLMGAIAVAAASYGGALLVLDDLVDGVLLIAVALTIVGVVITAIHDRYPGGRR